MKAYLAGFSALACILAGSLAVAQTQRALLIGINTYQPAGTTADHPAGCIYGRCELGTFENLDGSVNDAQAMADLLTSPKFGFPATNVALLTNPAPPHPSAGSCAPSRRSDDARRHSCRHAEISRRCSAKGRHRCFLRRQPRFACASIVRATSLPCWSTVNMSTPTAQWFPLTPTKAGTTSATAR